MSAINRSYTNTITMVPVKTVLAPKITLDHELITLWPSAGTPENCRAINHIIILCSRRLFRVSYVEQQCKLTSVTSQIMCTLMNSLNQKTKRKRTEETKLNNYNLVRCQARHQRTVHNKLEQELFREVPTHIHHVT